MEYERITCADVEVGDRIARAKTQEFYEVAGIDELNVTRRFVFFLDGGASYTWRPKRETKFWREVPWCTCGAKTPQGEYHDEGCPANA